MRIAKLTFVRAAAFLFGFHVVAGTLWAQQPVTPAADDNGVLQGVITIVGGAMVCAAAFMNPKRTHQT